jgi:hypothetical protein
MGPKGTDITTMTNTLPRTDETVRAGFASAIRNQSHVLYPGDVPLSARQKGGATGIATQAPATRPLAEDSPE